MTTLIFLNILLIVIVLLTFRILSSGIKKLSNNLALHTEQLKVQLQSGQDDNNEQYVVNKDSLGEQSIPMAENFLKQNKKYHPKSGQTLSQK